MVPVMHFGVVDVRDVVDLHLRAMLHPDAAGDDRHRRGTEQGEPVHGAPWSIAATLRRRPMRVVAIASCLRPSTRNRPDARVSMSSSPQSWTVMAATRGRRHGGQTSARSSTASPLRRAGGGVPVSWVLGSGRRSGHARSASGGSGQGDRHHRCRADQARRHHQGPCADAIAPGTGRQREQQGRRLPHGRQDGGLPRRGMQADDRDQGNGDGAERGAQDVAGLALPVETEVAGGATDSSPRWMSCQAVHRRRGRCAVGEGREVRRGLVDGQVGTPGGEDLGAAHEQAAGKLIEGVPGPVADALVRLVAGCPRQARTSAPTVTLRTPSTWSTSVPRSLTSRERAIRPVSSPSLRTTAASKDGPGLHGSAGQFEGAATIAAQQDYLLADEDGPDADGRVRHRRSVAAGGGRKPGPASRAGGGHG